MFKFGVVVWGLGCVGLGFSLEWAGFALSLRIKRGIFRFCSSSVDMSVSAGVQFPMCFCLFFCLVVGVCFVCVAISLVVCGFVFVVWVVFWGLFGCGCSVVHVGNGARACCVGCECTCSWGLVFHNQN